MHNCITLSVLIALLSLDVPYHHHPKEEIEGAIETILLNCNLSHDAPLLILATK